MRLHVHTQGKGFPILCLHGHPGSGGAMSVFTQHLSQRFLTLAPDLRGYGQSRVNESFEMNAHLNDLEALLERFQVKKCLVIGWSLGGILALELALRMPEQISGLILIASAARPRGNHPPVHWDDYVYTGIASILNSIKPGWKWNIEQFGKRSLYRYLINQHTPQAYHYLAAEGTPAYLQTSRLAQAALNQALRSGYDRLADLSQISCPSLVLAAQGDRHITPESSQETALQLSNCQWQCYPQVAHLFPWEIPDLVLNDLDHWINTYPQVVTSP